MSNAERDDSKAIRGPESSGSATGPASEPALGNAIEQGTQTRQPNGSNMAARGESLWDHKPWWCQPWTILTTGVVLISLSWLLLQRWWITGPFALAIGAWWWLFLVAVPSAYSQEASMAKRLHPERLDSTGLNGDEAADALEASDMEES